MNDSQETLIEGVIIEPLPGHVFRVKTGADPPRILFGSVGRRMRFIKPKLLPGDVVVVRVSRDDTAKGKIVLRTRVPEAGSGSCTWNGTSWV